MRVCGRLRRACPRSCRARRCLPWRRRIRGSAECAKRSWKSSQTFACSPLPQARRRRCCRSFGCGGLRDEIAAKLADILEIVQSQSTTSSQKWLAENRVADHHRTAIDQHRASRDDATNAVIHRQAIVHPVARLCVHHAREPEAPLHHASVADVGGLGHSRSCPTCRSATRGLAAREWPLLCIKRRRAQPCSFRLDLWP